MSKFSERITLRRRQAGLSYRELGRLTGISHTTFVRYESGEIDDIMCSKLVKIAKVLHCNPLWLMGYIDKDLSYGNIESKK